MPEEFVEDVAFQGPNDLLLAFALGSALGYEALCTFIASHPDNGEALERAIDFTVTAPVETRAVCLADLDWDWENPTELGQCGLGFDPLITPLFRHSGICTGYATTANASAGVFMSTV